MAALTQQIVNKSGDALTYAAAASGGDSFVNFKGVVVHAKNANVGATRTITIAAVTDPLSTPESQDLDVPDIVVTVPADGDRIFNVPPSHTSAGGQVSMTYDSEADLTLAVLNAAAK